MLSLLLSKNPKTLSLGSLAGAVNIVNGNVQLQKKCSCGKTIADCPIWGEVLRRNEFGARGYGYLDLVEELRDVVSGRYGEQSAIIEASKKNEALLRLNDAYGAQLKVIFLLKDVRTYVCSMQNNARRKNRGGFRNTFPVYAVDWYRNNKALQSFLQDENIAFKQIGYEELCLETEQSLRSMCDYLELEFTDGMLNPIDANTHILLGNRMRRDAQKTSGIHYDNRWFYSDTFIKYGWLLSPVIRWNNENVYQNIKGKIHKQH